jgi:phosphoribosyl-ATP pyrophosphohydrolase/phosphoribosyl-AMP cyclohydrolase
MLNIDEIDFTKLNNGLVPACIQDYKTMQLLMVGFMNKDALKMTLETKKVTFWSRTKSKLWVKGETSGNFLNVIAIGKDCDNDTILIYAKPDGSTCHTGNKSCFTIDFKPSLYCLAKLSETIESRKKENSEGSYTAKLFEDGIKRIAQKVGEEGVETALAAVTGDEEELANESADLIFHLLVLLSAKGIDLAKVTDVLYKRMK